MMPVRDPIARLEAAMLTMPQIELETNHYFANGMYCRVVKRPKDTTIVGKVHKHEHFYIVAKGRVLVTGGKGRALEFQAGDVIISRPGTKRAVYAIEDSICLTVHRTDKTDLAEVEEELVVADERSPFTIGNKLKALK